MGVVWSLLAVSGAYELNRRKFNWSRGSGHSDRNLLAGTLAVSSAFMIGGALQETAAALAIVPALSAVMQASDGHKNKTLTLIHAALLVAGIAVGIWFYVDENIGPYWIERIIAMP